MRPFNLPEERIIETSHKPRMHLILLAEMYTPNERVVLDIERTKFWTDLLNVTWSETTIQCGS